MRRASPSEQAGLGWARGARGDGPRPWLRRTLWTCPTAGPGPGWGPGPSFTQPAPQALSWHLTHARVPLSLDLQAGLDCCCLALQLPGLWSLLAAPNMVTHACSLIHCVRFILEASESEAGACCHLALEAVVSATGLVASGRLPLALQVLSWDSGVRRWRIYGPCLHLQSPGVGTRI